MDNVYENGDSIIRVRGLHKYFHGHHILKGIDFTARKGELISIIGRSGCGKTTLLRCLNGLEEFDKGEITVSGLTLNNSRMFKKRKSFQFAKKVALVSGWGQDTKNVDEEEEEDFDVKAHQLRSKVGMLFQGLNLFPNLTVLDNLIKAPMVVKKEPREVAIARAERNLAKVGMQSYMKRYPSQLSGGQAQRVAIARALTMEPELMLYDEPTAALDPELVEEVLQVMRKLHEEGMTQIVVTHALHFARSASDRVIFMEDGQIIEEANPHELFSNPKDERTRSYLSILND